MGKIANINKKREEIERKKRKIIVLTGIFISAVNLFNKGEYEKALGCFSKCFESEDVPENLKKDCLVKKDICSIEIEIKKLENSESEEKEIGQSEYLGEGGKENVSERLIELLNGLLSYSDSELSKKDKILLLTKVCDFFFSKGLINKVKSLVIDHKEIVDYKFSLRAIQMFLINEVPVETAIVEELLKILISVNNDPDVSCFIINFFIKNKGYNGDIFSDAHLKKHVEVMQGVISGSSHERMMECYGILGMCYQDGIVLPEDKISAFNYYLKAAEGGISEATVYLASLYLVSNQELSSDAKINSETMRLKIEELLRVIVGGDRKDISVAEAQYYLALFICIREKYIVISHSASSTAAVFSESFGQPKDSNRQELMVLLEGVVAADQAHCVSAKKILLMIEKSGKGTSTSTSIGHENFYQELIDNYNDPVAMLELAKILSQKKGNERATKIRVISLCARAYQWLGEDMQQFWNLTFLGKSIQEALKDDIPEFPRQTNQVELFSNETMKLPLLADLKDEKERIITLLENHSRLIKRYPDQSWRIQPLQEMIDILDSIVNDVEADFLIRGINAVSKSDIRLTGAPFYQSVKKILSYLAGLTLDSRQQVKLLWAISLFKPKHLPLEIVRAYLCDIKNLLSDEEVNADVYLLSSLIYALAMIDCDLRLTGKSSPEFSLAEEKIPDSLIEDIFSNLNKCCKKANAMDLSSIYRSYNYFHYYRELKNLAENSWDSLKSTIQLGQEFTENHNVTTSKMQREVAACLREAADVKEVEEETFVGGCCVDILIPPDCVIEVNGPSHYQFNAQGGDPIEDSAKEQVKMALLKAQGFTVHQISYKDWERLLPANRLRWLKEKIKTGANTYSYAEAAKNCGVHQPPKPGPSKQAVAASRLPMRGMNSKT